MRLTLRTLLALRDGVLDRNAAIELQQRLQQSGTAQAIAYRIDAVVGDRKLNPLSIDERATGLDANDVAQFLDGTMQPDRVPGMERKCLDHNALLAEIAAVHQVLSRAMNEPVHIHPSLRTRLYRLKSKSSPGASPTVPPHPSSPATNPSRERPVPTPHAEPTGLHSNTVPSTRKTSRTALSPSSVPHDELESQPSLENASTSDTDPLVDSVLVPNGRTNRELGGTGLELDDSLGKQVPEYLLVKQRGRWTSWGKPALLTSLLLLSTALAIGPWDRISKLLSPDPAMTPSAQNQSLRRSDPAMNLDHQSKSPKPEALDGPASTSDSTVPPGSAPLNTDVMSIEALPLDLLPVEAPVEAMPIDLPALTTESKTADPTGREPNAAPTQSPPGIELGILWKAPTNPESIVALAHREPLSQSWQWRRNRRDTILDGAQQMTFLPHTGGELISPSGMRWVVSDDTQLAWIPNASNTPRVRIITRNALARPSASSKRLQLELESGMLEILFDSESSLAGIETVDHHVSIDTNALPPKIQAHWTTRVTAVEGSLKARWLSPPIALNNDLPATAPLADTTWSIKKSEQIEATGNRIEPPHLSAAEWSPGPSQPSLSAAATVLRGLLSGGVFPVRDADPTLATADPTAAVADRPPNTSSDWKPVLEAMAANPDPMVAATALRGQIQLGQFLHLFGTEGVFRRPDLNPHWPLILDQLFRSLANPETHPAFLDAIQTQTAERYSQILPMIALPTNAELASGRDKALVAGLSDSLVDVRALAIHQLTMITDDPLGYDAMSPSAESVQRWKSALFDETIRIPAAAPGAPQETR
jgi:hypothetical protein